MQRTHNDSINGRTKRHANRFVRTSARDSAATELLHGCQVVTVEGALIGTVDGLLVDARTRQTRYVILHPQGYGASIAVPWHALYFDSILARLVFYTYC